MPCPHCGGVDRVVVGQDTFECRSSVVIGQVPASPAYNYAPVMMPVLGPCGRRYSRAEEQAVIAAAERARAAAEQQRQRDAESERRRQRENERRMAAWNADVDRMLAEVDHPVERRVQSFLHGRDPRLPIDGLETWFLSRAKADGVQPERLAYTVTGFFRTRHPKFWGWRFRAGGSEIIGGGSMGGPRRQVSVALSVDGRWYHGDGDYLLRGAAGYNGSVVCEMAQLLELRSRPTPQRVDLA